MGEKVLDRASELRARIEELPKGTLTYKTIKGKRQPYLQWSENGKSHSVYIKVSEREHLLMEIEERKRLQDELRIVEAYTAQLADIVKRQARMTDRYYIGYQDFETISSEHGLYIDKTLFIKEWWERGEQVTLITRPRRFGKTLMLSAVECFFSTRYANSAKLFEGLHILDEKKYRDLQGKVPVIFMTFAAVKSDTYELSMRTICRFLTMLYEKYEYLEGNSEYDEIYAGLSSRDFSYVSEAIAVLCKLLYEYHGVMPIVLLDEYDTPLQEAYTYGYWEQMLATMKALFNATFKTNPYLGKALLTGITRIAKASLFSDMNNVQVYTTTSAAYADSFGFTEQEVNDILDFTETDEAEKAEVARYYDGFTVGGIQHIYNPWSILCYAQSRQFRAYWVESGGHGLISELVLSGEDTIKQDMETLLKGQSIHKIIDENIAFEKLNKTSDMIWPLLLATGYLKAENVKVGIQTECDLSVTNYETMYMYTSIVEDWFGISSCYKGFCKYLISGDVEMMEDYLRGVTLEMVSYFDTGRRPNEKEPERFYHGLVLGMMVSLRDKYSITSNRESGLGRFDIMMKPLDTKLPAIIIEFKVHDSRKESGLEETAQNALKQIEKMKYRQELLSMGLAEDRICEYGFAFEGKEVMIAYGA